MKIKKKLKKKINALKIVEEKNLVVRKVHVCTLARAHAYIFHEYMMCNNLLACQIIFLFFCYWPDGTDASINISLVHPKVHMQERHDENIIDS